MRRKKTVTLQDVVDMKFRVMKHLPTSDLSLIVLKGHLLIEELLYTIVQSSLTAHPASIVDARLSFYQLAQIAMAATYEERLANVWNAIFAVNKIRNTLAHNLEPKNLEKVIRAFARAAAPNTSQAEKLVLADPEKQIGDGIEFICGVLAAVASSKGISPKSARDIPAHSS